MIFHKDEDDYYFEYENWTEHLYFNVSSELLSRMELPLPWDFVPLFEDSYKHITTYVWWPLLPTFLIGYLIIRGWWIIGKLIYNAGYLDVPEGTQPYWFWPRHLRRKKKK